MSDKFNFQSIKTPVELNSFILKLFYDTSFDHRPVNTSSHTGDLENKAYLLKPFLSLNYGLAVYKLQTGKLYKRNSKKTIFLRKYSNVLCEGQVKGTQFFICFKAKFSRHEYFAVSRLRFEIYEIKIPPKIPF